MKGGFEKATEYALRVLARKACTRRELEQKLLERRFAEETVAKVILEVEEAGYVDDREYARLFQETRDEWGYRRIRDELLRRGVKPGILDEVLLYDEEQEYHKALRLVREWTPGLEKGRLAGRLLRRGFDNRTVQRLVRKACGEST